MAAHPSPHRPRPLTTSRRRSAHRLSTSTDTTFSLPAYSSPPSARPTPQSEWPVKDHSHPLDEPPDYPQSAEEADQEDDFVPQRSPRAIATRRLRHRRSESYSVPASPSVDDLLERSVVALELSTNALLQSMDTQSRVSAIANDHVFERSLARQTKMLDLQLRGTRANHEHWMDDLDDVMERVNGLFIGESEPDAGISRSLPTGSSHMPRRRHHRNHLPKSKSESAYLHLSKSELDMRDTLRPPRALTQYVSVESSLGEASETTADQASIFLPSTTGLRSAAQIRSFAGTDSHPRGLRKSVSSPGPNLYSTPPTSAYSMLSHLASSQASPPRTETPASQSSPSVSDSTTSRTVRRHSVSSFDSTFTFPNSLRRSRSTSRGRSAGSADAQTPPLAPVRAMTPPVEELTPSSSSSSCSSNKRVNAFRTVQSLRKILDDAPDPKGKRPVVETRSPRPIFRPRTPAVAPSSGTSTATASVSRLFTRSSHHGSSSHHSKPKHSSLKQSTSKSETPLSPATPGTVTPASQRSSTPGTPRQVSFADLPEAHSGRIKRKGAKGKGQKGKEREDGAWWSGWFTTGSSAAIRYEERMEDKTMRGWGRPGVGGGAADEWML